MVNHIFFCRPDLIQFEKLHRSNPMHNLNNAFNVAEEKLGLTKLLDAEGENFRSYQSWSILLHIESQQLPVASLSDNQRTACTIKL